MSGALKEFTGCLAKVATALTTSVAHKAKRLAFLVLPGSFTPVHSQHLRALEIARDVMTNLRWHVIGGFLAPSDDDYVRRKLGNETWSLEKRLELSRLATDDSPWLEVAPWGEFSSYRVTTRLLQAIESDFRKELQGRSVIGVEVMGSDTAIRILGKLLSEWESRGNVTEQPWYHKRHVCCLVRPGSNSSAEIEHLKTAIQPRVKAMGIEVIMASDESANPLLEVSSHEIRSAIARQCWDQLSASGWLSPRVLYRLQEGFL
jgi:nicotinic acid mononucleotide adenylyltransferase